MTITKGFEGTVSSEASSVEVPKNYRNSTYNIVSKVGYLIGVPKRFYESDGAGLDMKHFEELHKDKNARIIRNLCMLRTAIEQNYGEISYQIFNHLKNLHT